MISRKFNIKANKIIKSLLIAVIILMTIIITQDIYTNNKTNTDQKQLEIAATVLIDEMAGAKQISQFDFKTHAPANTINITSENVDNTGKYYLNINNKKFGPYKYSLFYVSSDNKSLSIDLIDYYDSNIRKNVIVEFKNWDEFNKIDQFTDRYGHPIGLKTIYYIK